MEKIVTKLLILMLLVFASCGRDTEQARKYADMKSECDSLIAQADSALKNQETRVDSLRKINDGAIATKTQKNKVSAIEKKITNIVDIENDINNVIKLLEAIKIFAQNGEKANGRIIYLKRKYMTYATVIQVHDENIMIQEITNGLSVKQYISKFRSKESKQVR